MAITISIPPELERELRATTPDLDTSAREAVLVDLYRQGKLYPKQLMSALEIDRWALETLLKKHNVVEDHPTIEDICEQVRVSQSIREGRQ